MVTIAVGATLQVEPGVIVKVAGLAVNGGLKAEGTAEKPILFTSSADSGAGQWAGIDFNPGSGGTIDHAELRYAGSGTNNATIRIEEASPTITHSTIRNGSYIGVQVEGGGSPEIAFNSVLNNGNVGVMYNAGSGDTGAIDIHDNLIEGNSRQGIFLLTLVATVAGTSLGGNTIKNNGASSGAAIFCSVSDVPPDVDENTLSGNTKNYIAFSGTLSQSATWTDHGYPIVAENGGFTIAKGGALTVGPGMTFKGIAPVVNGTLKAEGTAEKPILFTSVADSAPGQWSGIKFEAGGSGLIDHAELRYAGSGTNNATIKVKGASPTITSSTIRNGAYVGVQVEGGGSPEIAYNSIRNNSGAGVMYNAGSGDTGAIDIHDNLIEGNTKQGIYLLTLVASVTGTSLGDNTIKNNGSSSGVAIFCSASDIPPDVDENTLSGNKINHIGLSGTLSQSATWTDHGYPLVAENGGFTIAKSGSLTVGPGVAFKGIAPAVNGTLKVEGTAEKPILFTSVADSGAGQWGGIDFNPGSGGTIDYAELRYAGSGTNNATIRIEEASPTITHSTIRNGAYIGVQVEGGGSPEIAFNSVLNNGNVGVMYNAGSGDTGAINIHDNLIEGNSKQGIYLLTLVASVTGTSLGGNTLVGNGLSSGPAIFCSVSDVPPDVDENTLVANTKNYIAFSGTLSQSATWTDHGYPFVAENGGFTIAKGGALTVGPGMTFKGIAPSVNGTLKVEGTAAKPVLFTSAADTGAGQWAGLDFNSGSGGAVNYAELRYAGSGTNNPAIKLDGVSVPISHSAIRNNSQGGVRAISASPTIRWTSFTANSSFAVSQEGATGTVDAKHNYWGCASGPSPAGCGNAINGKVDWKPQAEKDTAPGHCQGDETQCGVGADPVSLATGYLTYSHRDLLLTNKSRVPLEFTRAYNSGDQSDTGLGPGWSQTGLANATELESGDVLVRRQDGRLDVFVKAGASYVPPSGVTDSLVKNEDGTFKLTTLEQRVYRFDASGRIASITDDHGLKTTYGYDANGRLATVTDPSAQTLTFSYDGSNHITKVTDSTGREVKYTYSSAGDLKTATDALGGVTEYTYDSEHRLKTIKDARGNVILKNTYDGQGRIVEQRDGLENLWKLEYKEGETVVTEPEGGKLTYGFDAQKRVVSETDQLGKKTTIAYDEAGNVKEILRPGGAKWVFGHDSAGNLTSVEDPEGGEREYEYDAQNRLTGFADPLGNDWSYEWSEAGDLKKITDPEEGETSLTYNESGQPLTVLDANGHETKFSYDSRGNRLSVTDPLEHKTSFEYNSRNQLTSKTAPGLKAKTFERNALGDLLARTTPLGNKTKYAYDANGLPTEITDPGENVWKIAYNAMARPITYTDPTAQQTTVSYNGNLKPTKIVNRRGKETTYAYDLANRITEVHGPESWDWSLGYDARGNRTSLVDPRENETTYEYDLADRMTESNEPLTVTTEYGYDANGQLTSVKDPRGYTTTYGYDDLGRLVVVAQPLEKATLYTYDGVGNVLSRSTAAGTLEYEYDAADRLEEVSDGEATLRAFGYDNADRITSATDAQGKEIEIAYNEDGRVASIDDGRGQSLARTYNPRGYLTKQVDGRGTLEYGYDNLGRLTSVTDPQSKTSTFAYDAEGGLTEVKRPGGIVTTNVFDDAGRLSESTTKAGEPATVLEALEYAYDPAGNLTSRTDNRLEHETTYAYDALSRITDFNPPGEGSTAYGYDAAGNRTSAGATTYAYNALNQLTSSSDGTTYSYDGAGRLIGKAKESEETTYSWDLFDHLASVESGEKAASYAYDALGRLSERTSEAGTQIAHYGDLTDLPTYDTNGGGETTTAYVRGASGLLSQRSGGSKSFPLADSHGDVTAILNATGEVASRQSYDPWGAQLSGPALEMGYLGAHQRRSDPATGLIQMGVRSYSPSLGRFLTEDRVFGHLGVGTSFDRYAYVWDNPLNLYDLDGRDVCVPTPFGDACAEDAAEDVGNAAGDAATATWNAGSGAAESAWNWTEPGRQWVGERAQDFWKVSKDGIEAIEGATTTAGECAYEGLINGGAVSPCHDAYEEMSDIIKDSLDDIIGEIEDETGDPPEPPLGPPPLPGRDPRPAPIP